MIVVIVLEAYPVVDCLANALPASEPAVVVEREVDASVEPGNGRLDCGLIEGIERARLLGRRHTVVGVSRVPEALDPEHVGKDARRRARLCGVSRGVARETRRRNVGPPARIDVVVDVGHRAQQVGEVLRAPALDERVVNGYADARVRLGCSRQQEAVIPCDLAHDGDPVPWRRAGGAGAIGPEVGNRFLLIGET